ncbi:MAG: helix-turn-helix domain-containing protein [Oscillospiraceae bacterium]
MKKQTLGMMIASLRKEKGMTQLELAEKLGVTDKAVSKWERDLSCPDVNTLPKLASVLGVTVDALVQAKTETAETPERKGASGLVELILKAVALAMGVAVTALSALDELDVSSGMGMLGIGLACLAVSALGGRGQGSK